MKNSRKLNKEIVILIGIVLLLFVIDYPYIDNFLINTFSDYEYDNVTRIIDGDTIETLNHSETIRLLGINCPEKGEKYSNDAKEFIENMIFHKQVKIVGQEKDRYSRTLAYIYLNNKNVNLELVKNGLANAYFPSRNYDADVYYNEFIRAWKDCVNEDKNLCEKSKNKCVDCISLIEFDSKNEKIVLRNNCDFSCNLKNWTIKDEGRKKFHFPEFVLNSNDYVNIITGDGENNKNTLYWKGETYVWTKSGDTLFLRDAEGYLVLWNAY